VPPPRARVRALALSDRPNGYSRRRPAAFPAQPAREPADVARMRCRALSRSIVAVLLVSLSACAAFPPLRASGQVGGAAGRISVPNGAEGETVRSGPVTALRATATPFALKRQPRRWDVGLGWVFDWTHTSEYSKAFAHGPVVELAWFTHGGDRNTEATWRGGPFAAVNGFLGQRDRDRGEGEHGEGLVLSLGALVEIAGPVEYRGTMAIAGGEYGVGLSLRGDLRRIDGETHAAAVLSLDIRFPGFAGVMFPVPQHRGPLVQ
jgi:hypothetical protein